MTVKDFISEILELRSEGKAWREIRDSIYESHGFYRDPETIRVAYYKYCDENKIDTIQKVKEARKEGKNLDSGSEIKMSHKANGELEATRTINTDPANLTIEEVAKLFGLDTARWECVSFTAKAWNTTMKGQNSKPMINTNYSVNARFKPIFKVKPTEEDLKWVFDTVKSFSEPQPIKPIKMSRPIDNLLVLPILDAHIGKLAWGKETDENYDIKIASERFRRSVQNIVSRASAIGFSEIIFPVGNDFFQYDNSTQSTTRGTLVDSDTRWKKLFKVGITLLREALDYCKAFAPVDVILVQGNHDSMMSFFAFEALRGWYDKDPMVKIDEDIKTRTYRKWGMNLLGFAHGDKEKDRLYQIMQQEARSLWGETRYAEWIIGHFHKNFVDERQGVTKRVVGSFSGTDAWHYENGFVGTLKSAQGIIYNANKPGPYLIIYESLN